MKHHAIQFELIRKEIETMTTPERRSPAFEDIDEMLFGKHRGERLQDVPASYLLWLWNDGLKNYSRTISPHETGMKQYMYEKIKLANYVWNSKEALEQELGDTFE